MANDEVQYIKLPDGSYGKFRADASDDVIRTQLMKDFPEAMRPDTLAQARKQVSGIVPDQTFAQRLQSSNNPGSFEGHPENVGEYVPAVAGNVASGVKDISQGNVARGTHKVISGVGNAFLPALPFMAAAGPAAFAKIVAMGAGGSYLGSNIAEGMGATPDQADVAGDIGGLASSIFGPKALTTTKGVIGNALRTPYGPTSGASALKPGVKAVSSIGKYVGGPELAEWMVPERSAGPTGPYSRLPSRLPTALRGDPFSPDAPAVEPELGSPENPGWMSKIPTRMPMQKSPPPELGSPENPGWMSPISKRMPKPAAPGSSLIVSPTESSPRIGEPSFGGSEGRAATWTNQDVMRLAQQGNREAIQQAVRRGMELPPGARYVMGDPDFSRTVYNPRESTTFTPEGTPIRNLENPNVPRSARQRIQVPQTESTAREVVNAATGEVTKPYFPQGNPSPFAPALPETTGDPFSPTPIQGFKGGINTQGLEASTKPISNSRMIDSLSSEIDTMKMKLRNSGAASSAEKNALQNQINDYQAHLDAIRRSGIH